MGRFKSPFSSKRLCRGACVRLSATVSEVFLFLVGMVPDHGYAVDCFSLRCGFTVCLYVLDLLSWSICIRTFCTLVPKSVVSEFSLLFFSFLFFFFFFFFLIIDDLVLGACRVRYICK